MPRGLQPPFPAKLGGLATVYFAAEARQVANRMLLPDTADCYGGWTERRVRSNLISVIAKIRAPRHATRCPCGIRNADFISQGAGFVQRGFDFLQIRFRHDAEAFFKPNRWQRADGLHVGDGFGVEKRQMAERHFEFAPAILSCDGNVDDERARGVEMVGDEDDGGAGFGGHAHVHQPDFAVARVHLPSRRSSFSCSTSRVGNTSAQSSCARWRSRNFK